MKFADKFDNPDSARKNVGYSFFNMIEFWP